MKASTELRKARARVTKATWIKGHSALDAKGRTVAADSRAARKFCAAGALWRTVGRGKTGFQTYLRASKFLDDAAPGGDVVNFNDRRETTLADVKKTFTRAAAAAAKKGD